MASKKILYFIAGEVATPQELLDIAALNAAAGAPYVVGVRNALTQFSPNYGAGKEDCDYVAGTVPTAYNAKTVFPGAANLQAGDAINVKDAANTTQAGTATNTAGTNGVTLASTAKIIKSGVNFPCPAPTGTRNTGYNATIVNGAITALVGY